MSFNRLKAFECGEKIGKLSEALNLKHLVNGDLLEGDHLNVVEIDKVPGCYTKVTKLNLGYNRISRLDGLAQFKFLTHLHLSHNMIEDFRELEKVVNKELIVVLNLNKNPVNDHPDIVTLALMIFPRLVELNGHKLSDHARQDIFDGIDLGRKLIPYLCKNEILIQGLDSDINKIKEDYKDMQTGKNKLLSEVQQSSEIDLNSGKLLKKGLNLPKLPVFTYHNKIRPYVIIEYIELVGRSVHYYMSDEIEAEIKEKVFKWLFCEVLLNLSSWGNHALQKFLQKHASDPDLETCFSKHLFYFQLLKFKLKAQQQFSDIFPGESLKNKSRSKFLESYLEVSKDWSIFPVFSANSDYLKALLTVLQIQMQLIEELQKEKEELLSFDATVINVPGFVDKFIEGNRVTSYDFSLDARASSRTTVKRFGSPLNASVSPQELKDSNELTDKKRKFKSDSTEGNETQEKVEQRLMEMKKEVEREKMELEKRLREMEKREKEVTDGKLKENQKDVEKFKKKMQMIIGRGADILGRVMKKKLEDGFEEIKKKAEEKSNKKIKDFERGEGFYRKKLMKKCFEPLRYFQILLKAKKIKANEYYAGRVLLDRFFAWKSFLSKSKQNKKLQRDAKSLIKLKKLKESKEFKNDFEKLLKRLTQDEKTIKKLWKIMRNRKNSHIADCLCGGFKCQVCVQEKTSFIRSELKSLKSKISKSRRSHSIIPKINN